MAEKENIESMQSHVPLVSVVLTTFDRADLLRQAVLSVLRQDGPGRELIVVDDGSRDHTWSVLKEFENRILILRQKNRGVSAARNRGIAAARGAYIAFLDSDDLWLPDKLKRQVGFMQSHPDVWISQTEEIWVRNGRRVNPKQRHRKPSGWIFEPSLRLCLVSPSAVMMRRALFAEVGLFDETLPACEDYDLWLRVACRFPVRLLDVPLIVKRGGHPDQLSRMPGLDKYRIRSLCRLLECGQLTERQRCAAVAVLQDKCRIYAQGSRKRGKLIEADYYTELPGRYRTAEIAGKFPGPLF